MAHSLALKHTYPHTHMYTYACTHTHRCTHTYTHTYTPSHTRHICMYTHTRTHTHTLTHLYTYAHTLTRVHTHTRSRTHGLKPWSTASFHQLSLSSYPHCTFHPHFSPKGFMNGSPAPRTPFAVPCSPSVVSDSLHPHGLQNTRPPCPSPTPGVYPKSYPSSRGCRPTISSSVLPFSSRFQSFKFCRCIN